MLISMSLQNDRYTYRITWSDDDQEYVGLCAEFPSLSWLARSPESALQGIRTAAEEGVSLNRLVSSKLSGNSGSSASPQEAK